ncbi:uncharacterized protein [Argopecten irradians]|uniref:uncharacterized protein n=1 Tax=Argopecten irradians TaxID=31199 RepID=UPI0037130012
MFRTAPCSKEYDALCEYVNQETTSSSTAETSSTPQTTTLSITTMMAETTSSTSTMMAETTSSTTKSSSPTTSLSSSTTTAEVTSSPSESSSRTTFLPTSITTEEATTSTATESTDRSVTSAVSMITTPSTTCDPALTRCVCKGNLIQLSPSELQESINMLKTNLAVMKNSTAIARRKRISVYDSRPSSQAVGGVACGIMSVLLGWIVIADLVALIMNICSTKPA